MGSDIKEVELIEENQFMADNARDTVKNNIYQEKLQENQEQIWSNLQYLWKQWQPDARLDYPEIISDVRSANLDNNEIIYIIKRYNYLTNLMQLEEKGFNLKILTRHLFFFQILFSFFIFLVYLF